MHFSDLSENYIIIIFAVIINIICRIFEVITTNILITRARASIVNSDNNIFFYRLICLLVLML